MIDFIGFYKYFNLCKNLIPIKLSILFGLIFFFYYWNDKFWFQNILTFYFEIIYIKFNI